MNMKNMKFEYR